MLRPAQKSIYGFCVGLLVFVWPSATRASETPNSCISCHRSVSAVAGVQYLEHDFADWEKSVHAKAGVTCEACHGGNPSAQTKSEAHKNLKPSMNPSSQVYFTRIPATCGTCHQAEFKAFQKSAHYQELQRSGRGPNCVTCHGSMANHILAPRELEQSCNLCHRQPTQAFATMMALNNAGSSLKRLQQTLEEAQKGNEEVAQQARTYQDLKAMHQHALEDWHTFKMAQVLASSQEITKRSNVAINELRLKEQQKKP